MITNALIEDGRGQARRTLTGQSGKLKITHLVPASAKFGIRQMLKLRDGDIWSFCNVSSRSRHFSEGSERGVNEKKAQNKSGFLNLAFSLVFLTRNGVSQWSSGLRELNSERPRDGLRQSGPLLVPVGCRGKRKRTDIERYLYSIKTLCYFFHKKISFL